MYERIRDEIERTRWKKARGCVLKQRQVVPILLNLI